MIRLFLGFLILPDNGKYEDIFGPTGTVFLNKIQNVNYLTDLVVP